MRRLWFCRVLVGPGLREYIGCHERRTLGYAREDQAIAERLSRDLKAAGLRVWLDTEELSAGANWRQTIRRVIRQSDLFIALLSRSALDKRGFVQAELRQALEVLEEFPADEAFIIPVRLDDCEPRDERLAELHRVDLFPTYQRGIERLLRDLRRHLGPSGPPSGSSPASSEVSPILREFIELSSQLASDGTSLLTLRDQSSSAVKVLAPPIHERVHQTSTRLIELSKQISLLCTVPLAKAAGNIAAVALILQVARLNPKTLNTGESDIRALTTDFIPTFKLLARQEMGILG